MKSLRTLYAILLGSLLLTACSEDTLLDEDEYTSKPSQFFQWASESDKITAKRFLMTNGVGFGYDAVNGGYCNFEDIKARVLDRDKIVAYYGDSSMYFKSSPRIVPYIEGNFYYSHSDYVSGTTIETHDAVNILGLYTKEKKKKTHILEDGVENSFYLTKKEKIPLREQFVAADDLLEDFKRHEDHIDILSQSFRESIDHLQAMNFQQASVDSFINVYGTHVIKFAIIGGELSLTIKNDFRRYHDVEQKSEVSVEKLLEHYNDKSSHSTSEYEVVEDAYVYLQANGGDQTYLSGLIGTVNKNDSVTTYDLSKISEWRNSIKYDEADEDINNYYPQSTAQLISMQVTPIWEFIEPVNEDAAKYVKAAIQQDITEILAQLDKSELFYTCFPTSYSSLNYQYQQGGSWKSNAVEKPHDVLIVSNGRYVAHIAEETISGRHLRVAYPIYNGRVRQACGLGVDADGAKEAFYVRWINGAATLTAVPDSIVTQVDTFYINEGSVSLNKYAPAEYDPATPIPYVEVGQGVRPSGNVQVDPFLPKKSKDTMLINCDEAYNGTIVNWTPDSTRTVWTRNEDYYHYIYNPTEVKPN